MAKKPTVLKRLTAKQKENLPQMMMAYLLIHPQAQTPESRQNLQMFINALSETSQHKIYFMLKEFIVAQAQQSIAAMKQQIESL